MSKGNSVTTIFALCNIVPEKTKVSLNKDGLDATVEIAYTDTDGKLGTHEVLMSDLTCGYTGMVKIWPLMKEVKDTIVENGRTAALKAKETEREAKFKAEQEARELKLKEKLAAREKAKQEKAAKAAARKEEIAANAKKREEEREAKRKAKEEEKAKLAEASEKAAKEKEKADTAKATKAAKDLAKKGKLS